LQQKRDRFSIGGAQNFYLSFGHEKY